MNKTYLVHSGIKGQRWGIRRYQNEDGTLTNAGRLRYGTVENLDRATSGLKAKRIAVGIGIAAVAAGGAVIISKNRRLKKELGTFKNKQAQALANLAKGREIRAANIIKRASDVAAGIIPPKNLKIPVGSNVLITNFSKKNKNAIMTALDVIGGVVKVKAGG